MMSHTSKSIVGRRCERRARLARGRIGIIGFLLAVVVLASAMAAIPVRAEILDAHVLGFSATPGYINLNRTTAIHVAIGASYGAGLDNYRVTVTKPDGQSASLWYNFTAMGDLNFTYGDRAAGFNRSVDQVGTYQLVLEHFDGAGFAPAGYAELLVTDLLTVTIEGATASNEYTDVHSCPVAQEWQRGGEIMGRAYVRYASTGEFVNGTQTPSAKGNITGTMLGKTKVLTWHNVNHFWRTAWFPAWNESIGYFQFTVQASDGRGNHGSGASPSSWMTTAWKITPAILKVVTAIRNDTGVLTSSFVQGDNVTIDVRVTYEGHNQHNWAFPGPMNYTRGGHVWAILGYGAYNATAGRFATTLATMALVVDNATQNWTGVYHVSDTDPSRSDLQVAIVAYDGASPPNMGMAFTTMFSFAPPPAPPTNPVTKVIQEIVGMDPALAGGVAALTLVAGLAVGILVSRRRTRATGEVPDTRTAAQRAEDEWLVEDEETKGDTS